MAVEIDRDRPLLLYSPQEIGTAFVAKYYDLLQTSPGLVHNFYHDDGSVVGRPAGAGAMDFVTTHEAIREKITSMDVATARIEMVDSLESHAGGVTVHVTGRLTGRRDSVAREFSHSFFLAPQERGMGGGFFVLNDVLRYVGDNDGHTPAAAS